MIVAGIDSGLYSTKVILTSEGQIGSEAVLVAGSETAEQTAKEGLAMALNRAGVTKSELTYIVVTGRGKSLITFANETAPDSICLAKGIYRVIPSVHCVVDVGAEKTLVIRCSEGRVINTAYSDKCASGTGTYLQMVRDVLRVSSDKMEEIYYDSTELVDVDNTCAVFAESEIISLIHAKKKPQDILAGVYRGLALRMHPLLAQVGLEREVSLVGGVALLGGVRWALEKQIGCQILIPENPLIISALGAAIIAGAKVGTRS
jgi:predicted CoA-substrate-specific enzyme activase